MTSVGRDIFVDLDGTLVRTDLFGEALFRLLKNNPLSIFSLVLWFCRGLPYAKARVCEHVHLDSKDLPIETELLDYLKEQKSLGRRLVLATACHGKEADKIAAHIGLFDHVLATRGDKNLKGRAKLAAIQAVAGGDFTYAGDCAADGPIWQAAAGNILVNAPKRFVEAARAAGKAEKVIVSRPPQWRAFLKEMRLHQYAKNVLIFVPLLTSHEYSRPTALAATLLAFVCFCLCASGAYFLNDLLDLPADRRHARKRSRPLASGDLSLHLGVVGAVALPLAALALAAALLPPLFVLVLAVYFLVTNLYSFALKRVSTADVVTLAILYTLRVVAGGMAAGIVLSSWLLAFSVFIFVSLGYLKRYIEVVAIADQADKAPGRGYSGADRESMFSLGAANATAAVVILALYINSLEVAQNYQSPWMLWGLCLIMLYWSNRIWIGARRGKIADDPIVFAISDKVSRLLGMAFAAIILCARYMDWK